MPVSLIDCGVKLVFPIFEQVTYLKKISEVRSLLMKKTMPLTKRLLGHQKKEMFYSMEVEKLVKP